MIKECANFEDFFLPNEKTARELPNRSFSIITFQKIKISRGVVETINMMCFYFSIRRRGVVGRVPAFQSGDPGSIPGGVRNFNFCPGIGCVSCVFCPVLSLAEALTLC